MQYFSIQVEIRRKNCYNCRMKQFISHQSALEYWRRCRELPEGSDNRRRKDTLPEKTSKIELSALLGFIMPVHILARKQGDQRIPDIVTQHVFRGETPAGCFMNAGNGLMASSPEFCFLQMAGQLTLVKLIELGYELCGVYSLPNACDENVPERGFYNRQPLTSIKKLKAFLDSMPGVKGRKKAMRALRYLRDGSASPMETKLAIVLILPYMLGGYGFCLPEMNKRIDIPKASREFFSKDYYVCDLFWPDEKIAVEYDSDQQHTGSNRIANDSIRRNALGMEGIRVVSVTKPQLYDSTGLEGVARTIAGYMGRRLFSKKSDFPDRHYELRKQLLRGS